MFNSTLSQGDTLENVAKELECIIETGCYTFQLGVWPGAELSGGIKGQLFLEYEPYSSSFSTTTNTSSTTTNTSSTSTTASSTSFSTSRSIQVVAGPHQEGVECVDSHAQSRMERKTGEQIDDFVRKLGFMDKEKEGGNLIKQFIHLSQVGLKAKTSLLSTPPLLPPSPLFSPLFPSPPFLFPFSSPFLSPPNHSFPSRLRTSS